MKRFRGVTLTLILAAGPLLGGDELPPKIDQIFSEYDSTRTPGCAVALMRDGRIVHKQGYGMANLDHDVPISPSTVFHVASVSKQFTAAAIVLLAQEGKLGHDDEIHQHLPELPDFGRPITIRQLVHHVSGLRDQWELLQLAGWRYSHDLITDDDVLWILERQRELNFEPGAEFLYSNSGYTLLGQIVERVSGSSLRQFTTEHIFEPLGMKSTFFRDDFTEIVKNQAYGYVSRDAGPAYRLSVTNFDTVGATSLLTTVEDMAHWDRNFIQPRVGGNAFVEQMLARPQLNDGEEIDYAFGIRHGTHRGLAIVEHSGGDAGYRSYFGRFPEHGVSVVCLCNVPADPRGLALEVAELALADAIEPAEEGSSTSAAAEGAVELDTSVLAEKEGLYWDPSDDGFLEIAVKEGALHAIFGDTPYELRPLSGDRFRFEQFPVEIAFELGEAKAEGGTAARLTIISPSGPGSEYERVQPVHPSDAELAGYAGAYASDEIEIPYNLRFEDGSLVLHRMKADPDPLQATMKDVFVGDTGTVRFTRDSDGRLSGFLLSSGRIRNLRFGRR